MTSYQLTMFVCDESQGHELGNSFAECVQSLFSTIHNVPEQFPPDYVVAALECLKQIAEKIEANGLPGDTEFFHSETWAGNDFIEINFRTVD